MVKVLLVKPPSMSDHIQPPLGLAYLAGAIQHTHSAVILDMLKTCMKDEEFCGFVKSGQFEVVGFQCYTQELQSVAKLTALVKSVSKNIVTIAGGPHPTLLPRETMEFLSTTLDYVLRGEADLTFLQFLNCLQQHKGLDKVPGLVWRQADKVMENAPSEFVKDLNALPLPAWELIQPQTYPPAQHGAFFKQFPIAPIVTTRGCPYACKFCSAPILSGRQVRFHDPDKIINEIRLLHSHYGIREIHIIDDNFTINRSHANAVLTKIIEAKLDISIAFPNGIRVETVDKELLDLMKRAGAYLISLGIESGSDRILQLMNKKLKVAATEEKVNLIHKAGLDIAGFFVIGFPGDTKEDIEKTIEFSLKLPLIRANYFDFLPLPGTPIYYELLEKGELAKIDWKQFHFMTAPYAPAGMTRDQLRGYQRKAFLRFYLRPGILIRNLLQIKSFLHFKYLVRRFYHWLLM
jgi:anaerobic magnesium-protoporphyrin IX monomethyl ester cyclase